MTRRLVLQHEYDRLASQITEHLKHMNIPKLIVPTAHQRIVADYKQMLRADLARIEHDVNRWLWPASQETQPMTPNLTTYTTEELERLTTLTEKTAKPGEFVRRITTTTFRMRDSHVTDENGYTRLASDADYRGPERRVVSFTDATELDPPQADMLAELARRKAPPLRFRKGDVVVRVTDNTGRLGALATVTRDCASGSVYVTYDDRVPHTNGSFVDSVQWSDNFRLATPADIAAYEARIPKASAFKVGELVVANGGTYKVGRVPSNFADDAWATDSKNVVWMCNGDRDATWEYAEKVRPATDAETAAYHRAHCQPKVEPKPAPKPASISNATHAGKKVRWFGGTIDYIVANMADGRIEAAPGIAVFLIEPSYGAIRYCYNAKELALSNGQ